MKEVKAYIRHHMVNRVIEALEGAGFTDMTLIDVQRIAKGVSTPEDRYSLELAEKYMDVLRLELVCRDLEAATVVDIIERTARTGRRGDGLIAVSPVETVVRISTGERGDTALRPDAGRESEG
ncbi:MAG: P-II family nitrogen regulator [Nitrospirota bacterium]